MPQTLGTDPGDGVHGYSTTIEGASTGPIGMITDVNLSNISVAQDIDISTMNTPQKWLKFIAGMKNAGEIALELLYEKTNMATILAAVGGSNESWTITLPDGSTFACDGYIKSLGKRTPMGDKISQSATFKLSGPPTFTAGS